MATGKHMQRLLKHASRSSLSSLCCMKGQSLGKSSDFWLWRRGVLEMESLPSRAWSGSDLVAGLEHVSAMAGIFRTDINNMSREELIKRLEE